MLSRLMSRPSHLRFLTLISSSNSTISSPILSHPNPNLIFVLESSRSFSNSQKNSLDPSINRSWNFSPDNETDGADSVFGSDGDDEVRSKDKEFRSNERGAGISNVGDVDLEMEIEGELSGDLNAESETTEATADSLIALKDLKGSEGLPPVGEIDDMRSDENEIKSTRAEMEPKKEEEIAKTRLIQLDERVRAYAKAKRKRSVAHVWIQPGDGKFIVNEQKFDVYFPIFNHRAIILGPFVETKNFGLWDVNCFVRGGTLICQIRAIRKALFRALQHLGIGINPLLRAEESRACGEESEEQGKN
ncbi:small ribosomal subunit protein uS9m-like [Tasmannia lanceolata]|uniref:small ribosomal subunit protein uS9m-like n=1 Tax=Tasmannia lanceolata TaxID=3420 RepID=UPI00406346C9